MSDSLVADRKIVQETLDRMIASGELNQLPIERVINAYKQCQKHLLYDHGTFLLVYGTAKFGEDFHNKIKRTYTFKSN